MHECMHVHMNVQDMIVYAFPFLVVHFQCKHGTNVCALGDNRRAAK